MEFIRTKDSNVAVSAITGRLLKELASGKKVLWLLCGGSNIKIEVKILTKLQASKNLENLALLLMDERFGAVGHKDSNWQQLLDAGADFNGAYTLPVISDSSKSLEQTVEEYEELSKVALGNADVIIGLFGLGEDGHTAGILPESLAVKSTRLVVGYDSPPFKRISMTKSALAKVDIAFVFAFGGAKRRALEDLIANKKSFAELPSKIFWDLPEVYVYNDQVGEIA